MRRVCGPRLSIVASARFSLSNTLVEKMLREIMALLRNTGFMAESLNYAKGISIFEGGVVGPI